MVIQLPIGRNLFSFGQPEPVYVGNIRQSGKHALTARLTKTAFYIIFQIEVQIHLTGFFAKVCVIFKYCFSFKLLF